MKVKIFICGLLFGLLAFDVQAKVLNLSVDKSTLIEGDTLTLTIEYDGESKDAPDLGNIGQDFNIVSNSSSQQFSFVNGVVSQQKKWSFVLQPLKKGKLHISPVRLDNLYSNSADVEVQELTNVAYVPDSRENSNSPYFQIEQEFDVAQPYVQQQVTFFVHIYDSIGLQNGVPIISGESQKDWAIVPLVDKPVIRQETINHKRMNIETYAFAAFPQKSGRIAVPQISFEGFYIKDEQFKFPGFTDDINIFGVDFHNVFGQRVPVRMKTKEQMIDVLPVPSNSLGASWMPLSNLELSAHWSDNAKFKTGEAVSRIVTFKAVGMTKSMLPKISFPNAENFKLYPEDPEITEQIVNGKVVTTASYNTVYIPQKSGHLTIPALKMQWFNVETRQIQTASLPEEIISVEPSNEEFLAQNKLDTSLNEQKPVLPQTATKETLADDITMVQQTFSTFNLKPETIALFVVPILFVVLLLFSVFVTRKKHLLRNNVIYAIKKHDYKKAKENLLAWGADKFGADNIQNFNDLIQLTQNDDFSKQLMLLNKILYSNGGDYIETTKFIEIFKKVDRMKRGKIKKDSDILPNLYD